MAVLDLTRRAFLATMGALGASVLTACGSGGSSSSPSTTPTSTVMFKRSVRSRRASKASKAHAANHLYATESAAAADVAHPGDNARVVMIDTTAAKYLEYFGSGATSVDLRTL